MESTMETARVYTPFNEFDIYVARIGAYVAEMQRQKAFTDTDYCETVEVDNKGRVSMLINGRGEVVAEFDYGQPKKDGERMMFVCSDCANLGYYGDYSGTDWSAERAEEIAHNLGGYEIFIDEGKEFVLVSCLGCGESGGDYYPAGYYDDNGELVTN